MDGLKITASERLSGLLSFRANKLINFIRDLRVNDGPTIISAGGALLDPLALTI